MHVVRVPLRRFCCFAEQVILPTHQAVVVSESRADRSDLIIGLRRALDPRSWSRTPDLSDVYRSEPEQGEDAPDGETVVEVTLLGLGAELEQDLDDRLALIDAATGLSNGPAARVSPSSSPARPPRSPR